MIILFIVLLCLLILQTFYDIFSPYIFFGIFLLFIAITIRVIKQCKKYGIKSVFRMSHRGKHIKMHDYVEMMLQKLPGYHHMKKLSNNYIHIEKSGIYYFYCFEIEGMITGDATSNYLMCTIGKNMRKINNPFPTLSQQIKLLEQELNIPIHVYIVLESSCQLHLKNLPFSFIYMKDVYYEMIGQHEQHLSHEQMDTYSQKIDVWLSKNVKKSRIA